MNDLKNAAQAIAYIHSLPHLHPDKSLKYVQHALKKLGNPQQKLKTIHVTGTNGKGSVCYYLTNLLVTTGLKVGTFASPYVTAFNERIQINGQPISDADLLDLTQQIAAVVQQIQVHDATFCLTEFEFLTVMMFQFFAAEKVDFGVIEVGIGGEYDKTNVIIPEVAIITNIGMDHAQLIGPTLKDIAHEKSGIIKSKRPLVLGEIPASVQDVIEHKAQLMQAPIYQYGKDFQIEHVQLNSEEALTFDWHDQQQHFQDLKVASFAPTQAIDAAIALKAYWLLFPQKISTAEIKAGLAAASLPARTQIISHDPLIILDGAHNLPAIKALLTNIVPLRQKRRLHILYAAMVDKDRTAILHELANYADDIIITTLDEKRAAKNSDYSALTAQEHYIAPWQVAFAQAITSLDNESILLICGSLHFASAILELLRQSD